MLDSIFICNFYKAKNFNLFFISIGVLCICSLVCLCGCPSNQMLSVPDVFKAC